jgi:hypothetical protein
MWRLGAPLSHPNGDLTNDELARPLWYKPTKHHREMITWWLIPLRVNPLITGVITHLLSGMNHQA